MEESLTGLVLLLLAIRDVAILRIGRDLRSGPLEIIRRERPAKGGDCPPDPREISAFHCFSGKLIRRDEPSHASCVSRKGVAVH